MTKVRFFKRYSYIINTIKRKKINTSELTSAILDKFDELNSYSTRTLSRDINDIQSIFGIEIYFNRKEGYYEITKQEQLDEDLEKQKQLEAFQFVELASIAKLNQDILLFEQRKQVGYENINSILDAIKGLQVLKFNYLKFDAENATIRKVKPLALREHNSRWYLIAEELDVRNAIRKSFGLDRILNLEVLNESFVYPSDFNLRKHFENIFGVGDGMSDKLENVLLSFSPVSAKYIETLPLHPSQREVKRHEDHVIYEYTLFINQELVREIVKMGSGVKVLRPLSLKNEVVNSLKDTLKQYD